MSEQERPRRHRLSILDLSQWCPLAPVLSDKYGSGRAAAMSNYVHAKAAGDLEQAKARYAALDAAEQEDADGWHMPGFLHLDDWTGPELGIPEDMTSAPLVFDPGQATWEAEVALRHSDGSESIGHPDAYQVVGDVVVVVDLKRSRWTKSADPGSLQLAGYGVALCDKLGLDKYLPIIFALEDGEYMVGEVMDINTPDGYALRERLEYAATHEGQACTGGHCNDCYQAQHCPEFLAPAALVEDHPDLAALREENPTDEQLAAAIHALKAAEKLVNAYMPRLKGFALRRGGIRWGGKMYVCTTRPGRESTSAKSVRAVLATHFDEGKADELARKMISKGKDIDAYLWKNDPTVKKPRKKKAAPKADES